MSGTSGTQASTKGESTSSKSSKSGYDHLDINKLYKGKSTEPVTKTVTQKHGMQTLGKAPPARRGGSTVVKSETSSDLANSSAPSQPTSLPPNIGQSPLHPPGWSNSTLPHPPGTPSPHSAPNVPTTGPAMHDKNWSGGPDRKGNFPSAAAQDSMQRFAQEFPSLDSGGDTGKGPTANVSGTSNAGHQQMSKSSQDNQYGPGPILRPQTEGSWTQGAGRGMQRPPGPPPPSGVSTREFGPERPNLGGPTPPPMSVGQGGHPPPPLGAFPMQFPRPPFMYPNAGGPLPPGPGFFPHGPGMPHYGMPIPPGAPPPPSSHPPDGPRELRGRGPPLQPMRPASHFASKPIIKQEELERMDELGAQDGGWATVQDDIDYNKRISFSDDEGEDKGRGENSGRGGPPKGDRNIPRQDPDKRDDDRENREPRRSIKILERQQPPPINDRNEREPRDRDSRFDSDREPLSGRYNEYENDDDWKRKQHAPGFEPKERDNRGDRDRVPGRGRMPREEESWRSGGNNRFQEDDPRNKKVTAPVNRIDPRVGGAQYQNNLPPRLQRNYGQPPIFSQSASQRKTPSPVPAVGSGNAVNKERDYRDRDRDWDRGDRQTTYKILERNRGDSESSKESGRDIRERRFGNSNDNDSSRLRDKDSSKRLSSDSGRFKDEDMDSKATGKDKLDSDSVDNYHSDSRKQDDAKASFRSKPPFTSSWADEVDDEEYNSRDDDERKGGMRDGISSHMKRDIVYPDDRRPRENTVPRRVIIQQTKVENMRSDPKPEPVVEPKPDPVKIEKPVEKIKSSAWGDRDAVNDKNKNEESKDNEPMKDNDHDSLLSDKDQSFQKPSKPEISNMSDKPESIKDENDKSHHGLERKGSREKIDKDRHYDRYGSGGRYDDRRQDKQNMSDQGRNDNRGGNMRDNRPKARRMDSYENKRDMRDNRTPDRDQYGGSNRNNSNDGSSTSAVSSRNSQEKDQDKSKSNIEKSKSGDRLDSLKDKNVPEKSDKDDFRRDRDYDKDKDYDRHNRNDRDDYDSQRDGRGHRGGRGRERGGYGIYQPRGGNSWGSDSKGSGGRNRGRGGGGGGRDFYDPKPKRVEPEKDEKPFGKDETLRSSEPESIKEKTQDKGSDFSNKGSVEDLGSKKREKDGGNQSRQDDKKGNKSPGTSRRNARGGTGARLQGYGPPSDKTPFSTNQTHKDEELREKPSETQVNKSGPVPLMALGDISPPNLQNKARHHGTDRRDAPGGRGRGMPPRMQRDEYSFRDQRGGGNKRGGGRSGDAKPLMSINSNEVEGNEWESGSESGDDDSKRSGQQSRKDGVANKSVSDRFRQSQNINKNGSIKSGLTPKESTSSNPFNHTQDAANNNKGKGNSFETTRGSSSNFEIDCYSSGHQTGQDVQQGGVSDTPEGTDGESGGYQKKNSNMSKPSSDKSSSSSVGPKSARQDPKPSAKDRRVKSQPYDPRPNSSKSLPPRFFSSKEVLPHKTNTNNHGQPNICGKSSDEQQNQTVGTWEKTVSQSQPKEPVPQPPTQATSITPSLEIKDSHDSKVPTATSALHQSSSAVSNSSILDSAGSAPVKTMIFENTNYKSINNTTVKPSGKPIEPKKDGLPSNIELTKDLQLGFGKVVGEVNHEIDFNTFNDGPNSVVSTSQQNQSVSNQQTSKPMAIGPSSRSFVSHQPSPISPQAADLNEKVQSVKRIWDVSPMPSVAEQSSVCGSDDNSFHGGFTSDSFKGSDNSSRDFSSSLQQPTSGYAPGSSPALSAISKPESSSSPTSSNLRIAKPQQQNSLDNQGQSGISSSPFGSYSMPQQQGSNAFSGMPAVPSPPSASVMYGTSQTLHAVAPASGIYQAFSHVDAPVVGATSRQYQQYAPQAAASGHYGLFLSTHTHTPMDYQSMSSYQHQHQQGSQGPPGQAPSQNSRISPGPMTTTGGGNSAGVIISSTSSLMNMKPQAASSHPNMPHQVVPGTQQGYSQLSHHHPAAALSHPQHHLGAVGPVKGGYSQSGVFIPFDASQTSMIGLGQNFLSSAMRSGPPGGPPPPATPPVQALQASSTYYSGSSGNQSGVYPTGSNQGNNLQQLHVAVAPNPQGLPGLHNANPQFGLQYPAQLNLQSYNQQAAASTVSALNLSNQLIRNPGPGSHSFMKQSGLDLVQSAQMKSSHDQSLMNQNTWNSAGFALSNQSFHGGNKAGSNQDRNSGNNIGNQRKGNSHAGNVPNMKYMSNQGPGGYSGQVQQQ